VSRYTPNSGSAAPRRRNADTSIPVDGRGRSSCVPGAGSNGSFCNSDWHVARNVCGVPTALSAQALNDLSSQVLSGAVTVHRAVGPGLFESAYLACLAYELTSINLHVERQRAIPLVYRGVVMDCGYRADLVVQHALLLEVKAVDSLTPLHAQQLYTYLRLGDYRLGLLLNFGAPTMKEGIRRVVNGFPDR
jgi:GxxExxY protein